MPTVTPGLQDVMFCTHQRADAPLPRAEIPEPRFSTISHRPLAFACRLGTIVTASAWAPSWLSDLCPALTLHLQTGQLVRAGPDLVEGVV